MLSRVSARGTLAGDRCSPSVALEFLELTNEEGNELRRKGYREIPVSSPRNAGWLNSGERGASRPSWGSERPEPSGGRFVGVGPASCGEPSRSVSSPRATGV